MTLNVKFGQTMIYSENLQNLAKEYPKQKEWTENKIYKLANDVEVKTTFTTNKTVDDLHILMNKLKTNKDILEQISNLHFSQGINLEKIRDFQEHKREFIANHISDQTRKKNLVTLSKTATSFKNIEFSDLETINNTDPEEMRKFKKSKLLDLISKYKNNFLMVEHYPNLTGNEKQNLIKFLEEDEKKKNSVHDINDFCMDLTNLSISSIPKSDHPVDNFSLLTDSTDLRKGSSSDLMVSRVVLCDEFRTLINNYIIKDEHILRYFEKTQDMAKAAEMYFQDVYRANLLRVTLALPNGSQHVKEYSFVSNPEELFIFVYSIFPDANDPKIFKSDNKQIVINPNNDKFIGALGIPQNSLLRVKL